VKIRGFKSIFEIFFEL